jgi:hypothetical protein
MIGGMNADIITHPFRVEMATVSDEKTMTVFCFNVIGKTCAGFSTGIKGKCSGLDAS